MSFQLFTQLFSLFWLLAILVLLIAIWRSSEHRLHHIQAMEKTMFEVAMKDAESARQAVEITRTLVALLQNAEAKQ